jgi:hypothetical protein
MTGKSVQGKFPKRNNFMTIKMRIFKSEFELTANSYKDEKRSYGWKFYADFSKYISIFMSRKKRTTIRATNQ